MSIKKIVFSILLISGTVHAEGAVRCGNSLISVGDSKAELMMKCGQPLNVDKKVVFIEDDYHNRVAVEKEVLTIDQGEDKFMAIVTVDGGKITDIQDGPRNE